MLTAGTVPWALNKQRRADIAESERSLLWMVVSRTLLLALGMLALWVTKQREALAWTLMADASLQLFDALVAVYRRKHALAALPAVLCLLGGLAGIALLR